MMIARLVGAVGAVAIGAMAIVTVTPAKAESTADPSEWRCTSTDLGTGRVTVERAPVDPTERESDGSRITPEPTHLGTWVPVVLVHGWTGRATHPNTDGSTDTSGAFSHHIDLTANRMGKANVGRSLVGQLQGIPGAAVWTFDYHPYSARWVTDENIGPTLAKVVNCLAEASGQNVVIVGHSMGGLAAKYAASTPGADDISRIITLGTPTDGSFIAAFAAALVDSAAMAELMSLRPGLVALLRLLLAGCGAEASHDMDSAFFCGWMPDLIQAFDGQAGQALRAGSAELRELNARTVPSAIDVDALAGATTFTTPGAGWFTRSWKEPDVHAGDIAVLHSSATAGATSAYDVACGYQLDPVRWVADEVGLQLKIRAVSEVNARPVGALTGPCMHPNLMRSIELTNELMGLVSDDIASRDATTLANRQSSLQSFEGTWTGDIDQRGAGHYSVVLEIEQGPDGQLGGTVRYPELNNCSGYLADPRVQGNQLTITEHITNTGGRCVNLVELTLSLDGPDTLHYLVDGPSWGFATGVLARASTQTGTVDPSQFLGTWSGGIEQPGSRPYTVVLTLVQNAEGQFIGQVRYPELDNCSGHLSNARQSGDTLRITETITVGTHHCIETVELELRVDGDVLHYSFGGGGATGHGALTKAP